MNRVFACVLSMAWCALAGGCSSSSGTGSPADAAVAGVPPNSPAEVPPGHPLAVRKFQGPDGEVEPPGADFESPAAGHPVEQPDVFAGDHVDRIETLRLAETV